MKSIQLNPKNNEFTLAEFLYVEKNYSIKAVAAQVNKNVKTIVAWRDKYNWEQAKELLQGSPVVLKKLLLQEAINISKGEKPTFHADSLSKVMKAFDYMAKKTNPAIVMEVLMELDAFHARIDPVAAAKQTAVHKLFLSHKIQTHQ